MRLLSASWRLKKYKGTFYKHRYVCSRSKFPFPPQRWVFVAVCPLALPWSWLHFSGMESQLGMEVDACSQRV